MRHPLLKLTFLAIFVFSFNIIAKSQTARKIPTQKSGFVASSVRKTVIVSGKMAGFVVKQSANAGWQTTKFATTKIAAPIVNEVVIKALPKVSGFLIKKGTPIALKLLVTYIKL